MLIVSLYRCEYYSVNNKKRSEKKRFVTIGNKTYFATMIIVILLY